MTEKQLQCFFRVAEELNYTRAAEKLFLSQSVVSYQIRSLEEELGFALLNRDRHSVSLTRAGESYYEDMRYVLSMADNARNKALHLSRPGPRFLRLGIGYSWDTNIWDQVLLSKGIVKFRSGHPDLEVVFSYLDHADSSSPILENLVDLQFVYSLDEQYPPHIAYVHTSITHDYCLLKQGDPLWERRELFPEDLSGRTVFIPRGSEFHPVNMRMVKGLKAYAQLQHTQSFEDSLIKVLSDMGVAMIPHAVLNNPMLRTIPVRFPEGPIQLGLAWQKKDESPELLELVQILKQEFEEAEKSKKTE